MMKQRILKFLELERMRLTVFEKVWLLAPIMVWFSFQPLIRIGQNATMYFELSLALVYVAVLAIIGLPSLWKAHGELLRSKVVQLVAVFVASGAISLFWSPNLLRGLLTLGVLGVLFLIFLASLANAKRLAIIIPALTKLFIVSAVVMSVIAFIQVIAGIWIEHADTLLCAGCTATQFGFARPNVFTIEPQFFGNLLLAPALILTQILLTRRHDTALLESYLVITMALFLTLSRGAIFAFALGVLVLVVVNIKHTKKIVQTGGVALAGFLICLMVQGTAAALNPSLNETFFGAVSKSINQLSLGVIDIPAEPTHDEPAPTVSQEPEPRFDGYVEESTDIRLELSDMALDVWNDNPVRMLFGVGLGGTGVALHAAFPGAIGTREIAQNEYIEILLERGLVGLLVFVVIIAALLLKTWRTKWPWAIVAAFSFQWMFFSGYPNALHIYLVFIILAIMITEHHGRSTPAMRY